MQDTTQKIYPDTCIYIATIKLESKTTYCNLIFSKIKKYNKKVIVTDLQKSEIKGVSKSKKINYKTSKDGYEIIFGDYNHRIEIYTEENDKIIAKKISNKYFNRKHYNDCLHFQLAIKSKSNIIITDNTIHFDEIKDKFIIEYNTGNNIEIIIPLEAIGII